jgi:hypothetical protein
MDTLAGFFLCGAAFLTGVDCTSAPSQDSLKIEPNINKCSTLSLDQIAMQPTTSGQLFIKTTKSWTEVKSALWGPDYVIPNYHGEKIAFIYVAPPSPNLVRQFLSIRTVADATDASERIVNLRRHHDQFGTVDSGTYVDYHRDQKTSATLERFHNWRKYTRPDEPRVRSDEPDDNRLGWLFNHNNDLSRKRVLGISYRASDKPVCVPFTLGPKIASQIVLEGSEGDDEIYGQLPFIIEISEAKTGTGLRGHTFQIRSQPERTRSR